MNFTHLVGNTPMIRIRYKLDGREGVRLGKAGGIQPLRQHQGPSGGPRHYQGHAPRRPAPLKPGQPIVEVTSGNTGIAFSGRWARFTGQSRPHLYAGLGQ